MNAVLQALFHTPLLKEFFLSKAYMNFINTRKSIKGSEILSIDNNKRPSNVNGS